jgi:hypothetical protein
LQVNNNAAEAPEGLRIAAMMMAVSRSILTSSVIITGNVSNLPTGISTIGK